METNLNDLTISNLKNTFVVGYDTADFLDIAVVNREFSENNFKLAIGGLITEEIRRAVLEKTGYKCSAGIAHNKILAKLVCGLHKPNKQTILPHDAVEKFFDTIPINKIKSLGGKFGQTLAEDLQITFMGQLSKISERELTQRYDEKTAKWLYNISRGIDLDPVTTKLISKSIACCKNFQGKSALTTSESVQHWLNELAEEMAERLEKDMKENNRKAKQIVVSFTQEMNRKEISSSRTHPLTSYESKKIAQYAFDVIKKFCLRTDERFHLKFLGLSAGHFEDIKKVREITSFFKCVQIQENVFESESRVSSVQSLMDNSVKDDGIVDENINSVDYEVDPDVYLQLTQELEENVSELIFYDDTCRLKQELNNEIELNGTSSLSNYLKKAAHNNLQSIENLKKQTNRSPSSFFKQYFNQTKETKIILEDNTKNEVTQLVRCINQDEDLDENYETAPTEEELIDIIQLNPNLVIKLKSQAAVKL
ncbi:DNA polymerase eta [Asbolus verrucosus]|uniref:DNA polymerase eta n=1 Tax=Asbolus verrucosus TaxID=1661398 RepID=A0A482W4A6_ASBVE|nr:DNA polymerase eta [Asbolus verrucosus]